MRKRLSNVIAATLLSGCGASLTDYAPPQVGAHLDLVAVIESPPADTVSVTPLISVETSNCQFSEPQIIPAADQHGTTLLTPTKTYMITGAFIRNFALRSSQVTDDQVFTARPGRAYRAEFIYLPTGYSVRVFEDGNLISDNGNCG